MVSPAPTGGHRGGEDRHLSTVALGNDALGTPLVDSTKLHLLDLVAPSAALDPSLRCMLEYIQAVVPVTNQQEIAVGDYSPDVYRWRVFWGVLTAPGGNLTW